MNGPATHSAHLTLGLGCNNHCVFCAQRGLEPLDGPRSTASKDTAEAGGSDHPVVVFAGGEPTLHPDLTDRIRAAREGGARRVLVQTNGRRLAYKTYLDELVDAGLTHVDVSLHGHDPACHDYHTNVEGSFVQTARGLLNAGRSSLHVGVTTVLTRSNFRHLPTIASTLIKLSVDAWHIANPQIIGAAAENADRVAPRLAMAVDPLERAARRAHEADMLVVTSGIPRCIAPAAELPTLDPVAALLTEKCITCAAAGACGGVPEGFEARMGTADLVPFVGASDPQFPSCPTHARSVFAGIGFVGILDPR